MLFLEKRLDTDLRVLVQRVFNQSSNSFCSRTYFCLESKKCPSSNRELIQDKPKIRCWSSFLGYPQVVSHVYVHGAEGLQNQDSTGGEWPEKKPDFKADLQMCVSVSEAGGSRCKRALGVVTQAPTLTSSSTVRDSQSDPPSRRTPCNQSSRPAAFSIGRSPENP